MSASRIVQSIFVLGILFAFMGGGEPELASSNQASQGNFVLESTWQSAPDIRPASSWGRISGLEITEKGEYFIADASPDLRRISKIQTADSDSEVLVESSIDCTGADIPEDALCAPAHLAVSEDKIFVSDNYRDAVLAFDHSGTWLWTLKDIPGANGITTGPGLPVYAGSSETGKIHVIAPDGTRQEVWEVFENSSEGIVGGLDVAPGPRIFVLDARKPRILALNGAGRKAKVHDSPFDPLLRFYDLSALPTGSGSSRYQFWLASSRGLVSYRSQDLSAKLREMGALPTIAAQSDAKLITSQGLSGRPIAQLLETDEPAALSAEFLRFGGLLDPAGLMRGPDLIRSGADDSVVLLDRTQRVQVFNETGDVQGHSRTPEMLLDAGRLSDGRIVALDGTHITLGSITADALDLDVESRWPLDPGNSDLYATRLVLNEADDQLLALDIGSAELRTHRLSDGTTLDVSSLSTVVSATHWTDMSRGPSGDTYLLERSSSTLARFAPDRTLRSLQELPKPGRRISVGPEEKLVVLDSHGWVWYYDEDLTLKAAFSALRQDLAESSYPSDLMIDDAGAVLVADRALGIVSRYVWDEEATSTPPPLGGECSFDHDKFLSSPQILEGDAVEVTLSVSGRCDLRVMPPLDITIVVDASGSMAGDQIQQVRQSVQDFIQALDLRESRVGLVTFNRNASNVVALSHQEAEIWRALRSLRPFGDSRIDMGLQATLDAWLSTRRTEVEQVMILLSDGKSDREPALAVADRLKAEGMRIFTVSNGYEAESLDLMRDIASDPAYLYRADNARFLYQVFDSIAAEVAAPVLFDSATVIDEIPANMQYVANSASPGATFDIDKNSLTWELQDIDFQGFQLTYDLVPQVSGLWETNIRAWTEFTDGIGRQGRIDFPVPKVEVLAPTPTPKPPVPVYLPILLGERCKLQPIPADVLLLLDTSSSMKGEKLELAKLAALAFVDELRPGRDRIALIDFNTDATLRSSLSLDLELARAAIRNLESSPGTRIDGALRLATDHLTARDEDALRNRRAAIVLLTDGVQVDQPEDAIALARGLCAQGVALHAVGFGDGGNLDLNQLDALACRQDWLWLAPDGEALRAIFVEIAGRHPCEDYIYWGG